MSYVPPDSPLEAIVNAAQTACPGWAVEVSFSLDLPAWLQENFSREKMVLVVVQGDEVEDYYADGTASEITSRFTVFLRLPARTATQIREAYEAYTALREAFNGILYPGGVVTLGSGLPDIGGGLATPQFQLQTTIAL